MMMGERRVETRGCGAKLRACEEFVDEWIVTRIGIAVMRVQFVEYIRYGGRLRLCNRVFLLSSHEDRCARVVMALLDCNSDPIGPLTSLHSPFCECLEQDFPLVTPTLIERLVACTDDRAAQVP